MTEKHIENLGKRLGNIAELPEFLRSQIREGNLEGIEDQIFNVLNEDLEGQATLSEILVALYRRYGVADKTRDDITKSIYKIMRRGLIQKTENRKGVYEVACEKDVKTD